MATLPYLCSAKPLTADGLQSAMDKLGIDAATLWAMLHVETGCCGYLASRRPQILFERHLFSQLTHGQFDSTAPDVSNPVAGGYGAAGDFQYTRLAKAYTVDPNDPADLSVMTPTRSAALQSASWGLGQVLGANAQHVGFASVSEMVNAMAESEDRQLDAVVGFILDKRLETALQQQRWADYASVYNGPSYARNQYDTRLAQAYALFKDASKRPDLTVRTAQLLLFLLGYDPQGIDGGLGAHTLTALHNFQAAQGLTLTPTIDDGVLDSLVAAMPTACNLSLA